MARLTLRSNEVRLWLRIIAYNLANLWRRLALPAGIAIDLLELGALRVY
jgi:hypothetical protein